jgi:hypothetical protein
VYGGEPPRRRRWVAVLLTVAGLAVLGGAAAAVALTHADGVRLSPGTPAAISAPPAISRTGTAASSVPPRNPGWQVIDNRDLQFAYEVPPSWQQLGTSYQSSSLPNVTMSHIASFGDYSCGGRTLGRGTLGSTSVAKGDPAAIATNFARSLGDELYAQVPHHQVVVGPPRQTNRDGPDGPINGVQVDAAVTGPPDPCTASRGVVKVLALEARDRVVVLVVNGDLAGGPATPAPPAETDLQRIVDSARPAAGK